MPRTFVGRVVRSIPSDIRRTGALDLFDVSFSLLGSPFDMRFDAMILRALRLPRKACSNSNVVTSQQLVSTQKSAVVLMAVGRWTDSSVSSCVGPTHAASRRR
jgi:hypothetical protein